MICSSCGKEIADGVNFCRFCGAKTNSNLSLDTQAPSTEQAPVNSQAAGYAQPPAYIQPPVSAELPVQSDQPKTKKMLFGGSAFKKGKKQNQVSEDDMQGSSDLSAAAVKKIDITPGSVLLTVFLSLELLPYLMRSLVFVSLKQTMPFALSMLCGIVSWCAAGGLLFLFAKKMTGYSRLPYVLSFLGLIGIYRGT